MILLLQMFPLWRLLTMTLLTVSLRNQSRWPQAAIELGTFVIFILLVFLYFAVLGNINFGRGVEKYSTAPTAIEALVMILVGDFDYYDIRSNANPVWTGLFFGAYLVIVIFVLINTFIAIITKSYETTREEHYISTSYQRGGSQSFFILARTILPFGNLESPTKTLRFLRSLDPIKEEWTIEELFTASNDLTRTQSLFDTYGMNVRTEFDVPDVADNLSESSD